MKKSLSFMSVIFGSILLVLSCSKSNDRSSVDPLVFKVDKNSLMLGGAIDMKDTLNVTSSGPWSLSVSPSAPSWFSINQTGGNGNAQVILTTAETNRSGTPKTATLTLTPSGGTSLSPQSITVTQRNFSLQDSAAILMGRWKLVKDSSTNIGGYYFVYQGQTWWPNAGVYIGRPSDYYDFKPTGIVDMYGNGQLYTCPYKLHPNNRLVIDDLQVHDSGKVIKLTPTEAIFDWQRTSPNGGRYFRRTYLGK